MMSDCHMLRINGCDADRHAETRKRVDIYKSVSVACARATRTRQTVCDPDRQADRQGHEKGMTFIRVEDVIRRLCSLEK